MHQPKIAQVGFQCLLDSGICFPAHAQKKKTTQPKQNNKTTKQTSQKTQPTTKNPSKTEQKY